MFVEVRETGGKGGSDEKTTGDSCSNSRRAESPRNPVSNHPRCAAAHGAQIVLLAGKQRLTALAIAIIVREDDQSVLNWLKRYLAEGLEGLKDRLSFGSFSMPLA